MYFHNHAVQSQNHMWLGWLGFKCWSAHGCCCRSPPSGRSWWSPEEKVTKLLEKQRLNLWLSSAEDLESQPRSQRNVDPHGSHLDDLPSREVEGVLAPDRHLRHLVPPCPPPPEVVEEEDKNKLLLAPPLIFYISKCSEMHGNILRQFGKDCSTHRDDPQVAISFAVDNNLVEAVLVGHLVLDVDHPWSADVWTPPLSLVVRWILS